MIKLALSIMLLGACGKDEAPAPPGPAPPPAEPVKVAPPPVDAAPDDGSGDVATLVVHDVGSKALGSQTIEASCVSVVIVPAGDWSVASARLNDCGDKTARSIVWLFKRQGNAKWSEDYAGQPPKCWKGLPPDLRDAVAIATKIHGC
ncbi:MAG TPA: hypothetical protein VGM39_21160 [Kofleriaceae bacterium]